MAVPWGPVRVSENTALCPPQFGANGPKLLYPKTDLDARGGLISDELVGLTGLV